MRLMLATFLALLCVQAPAAAQDIGRSAPKLSPERGDIAVSQADAVLELGETYQFYGPTDARTILVELWENPTLEAEGVLGIVMPADSTPDQRSWGAVITWEPIGWVSGADARSADYGQLLTQMRSAVRAQNPQRRADGFPEVQVMGWAQEPRHDSVANTVSWARELHFFDGEPNTLHYDLRMLGRRGVLSMNMVGTMDQLPQIRTAAQDLSGRAKFNPGARYSDFVAEQDRVADYGVAGLVATGVGVAVAKNIGIWALLAKLVQPLGIALLVLATALFTPLRRLFTRQQTALETTR